MPIVKSWLYNPKGRNRLGSAVVVTLVQHNLKS